MQRCSRPRRSPYRAGRLDSINSGSIYRFYTKPWTDEQLRENIRQAFQFHWRQAEDRQQRHEDAA